MAAQQDDSVFSIDPSEFVATGEMANSFFDRSAAECQALDEDGDQPSSSPSSGGRIRFHPFIRTVQKIVLYETKSRFYIVGSNSTQDRFRVLKVHRTEPKKLILSDDDRIYDSHEIKDILNMVDTGNRSKGQGQKTTGGLTKVKSAFGIAGFVRFHSGYYIILITKRRRAAIVGHHYIYKIEDTEMIYVPNEDAREQHPEETRYVKMFQAIDMRSNFYFSYSYDVTNTLQQNAQDPSVLSYGHRSVPFDDLFSRRDLRPPAELTYVSKPVSRFMWNEFLLKPVYEQGEADGVISQEWILPVIHGFVDQANISIYGKPVYLTLIARRSNRFAGTRFLKRGANFRGDVANEVETEQIVGDASISDLKLTDMTSFVQIRGSFPGHWSQDTKTRLAKPPIYFQLQDPFGRTSGNHFNHLLKKYGSPVVVMNLVKKKEKRQRHEGLIGDEFQKQIEYLNQFLPAEHNLRYVHLDMARCKKRKDTEVMQTLADIATYAVSGTGIYHRRPDEVSSRIGKSPLIDAYREQVSKLSPGESLFQTGVVRTNCVDCLDRTNTAQFVVAKCALGLQLFSLGFLDTTTIEFDSDVARMLESMFEDHGDTLALQYGGSQLIHRIRSYRKLGKWTNKANDITQTVKRYYSNTRSDAEKQIAMDVFLGVYQPSREKLAIWDKDFSEIYLHLKELSLPYDRDGPIFHHDTHWFDRRLHATLPLPLCQSFQAAAFIAPYFSDEDSADLFGELHRSFEFTPFIEMFHFKGGAHSVRDYMPNCDTDYSPFVVRQRETKKHEEALLSNVGKNPLVNFFWSGKSASPAAAAAASSSAAFGDKPTTVTAEGAVAATGMSSPSRNPSVAIASSGTASNNSDDSETEEEEEDDLSMSEDFDWLLLDDEANDASSSGCGGEDDSAAKYPEIFPGCDEAVGFKIESPSEGDMAIFDRYCGNSRRIQPHHPYSDDLGIKSIFPYISESNRDDFGSTDIKEYADKGFVFRPSSNTDMELFDGYAKGNDPAHFGKRVKNAYQEFAMMTKDFSNNQVFY